MTARYRFEICNTMLVPDMSKQILNGGICFKVEETMFYKGFLLKERICSPQKGAPMRLENSFKRAAAS